MKKIAAITAAIVLSGATMAQAQSLTIGTSVAGSAAGVYPIVVAGVVFGTVLVIDDSGTSGTTE